MREMNRRARRFACSASALAPFAVLAAGCAKGGADEVVYVPPPRSDGGALAETGPPGAGDAAASDASQLDGAGDGAACTLGTGDHCGACATSCGVTDAQSLFGCTDATSAGTCTLTCRAESYDVDGKLDNGCEANDPVVQDTAATAVAKALDDTLKLVNLAGIVYGDARPHEVNPIARPLGREDWYRVAVTGIGNNFGFQACLGISSFPADDVFEVCTTDANGSTYPPANCGQPKGGGGTSVCVKPAGGANAGVYFVRVRKLSGSSSPNQYALFMQH